MNIFRQLRWKLTLSYTLVTVSALLVVILVMGGLFFTRVFLPNNYLSPEMLIEFLREQDVKVWSHILSQSPVDMELIKLALNSSSGTITSKSFLRIGAVEFSARTVASLRWLVVGPDGTLLGKFDPYFLPKSAVGQPLEFNQLKGLEAPLQAALVGETNSERLYTIFEPNNKFLIALPIPNPNSEGDNPVLGVIVVLFESFPTQSDIPWIILNIAGKSLLFFILGTGLMGAVFGAFNANGIVTRFKRLSTITDAWSLGDFSRFIEDTVGDEITHFAVRLNNMARQLQSLLRRRQEVAVAEERNRLARDLHDSAKQQALAASFQLGTALTLYDRDPPGAKEHLLEAEKLVDSVRKELTNLVHELRLQSVEGQDFSELLNEYTLDWSQRSGIDLDINTERNGKLSVETRESLFRITQEALANIARHSAATRAEIFLDYGPDFVTLKITDDGCGFDVNVQHSGLGLYSMRERAEILDGSFSIESSPDQGTQIVVTLPKEDERRLNHG